MPVLSYLKQRALTVYRRFVSPAPSSRTLELEKAYTEREYRFYATQQPFASPLSIVHGNVTGETWEMRRAYREWAVREPAAKAALLTKCFAVAQLDPQTHPADPDNPDDKRAAEWLKYSVQCSVGGWPNLINSILLPGLIDGFSVNEKVFTKIDSRDNRYAGWWTLKEVAQIDTQFLRFRLDTFRRVTGIQAVNGAQNAYALPPQDFILYTHLKMFENPFGFSDLRAAVRSCRLIESAIRLRHILLTNYSGPFLKATSGDATARMRLMEVLDDARANGWIVVPEGCEVEVESLAVANLETFRAAIEDYRQEIVQSIQGAYLQLLEGVVPDARGDTNVAKGVAELFVWWLAVTVCETINSQLVPDLITPNFGNRVGFPRVTLGGIDDNVVTAALQRFKAGQELGLDLSKKQVTTIGGFDTPADDKDKLAPPNQGGGPGGQGGQGGGGLGSLFAHVNKIPPLPNGTPARFSADDVFSDVTHPPEYVAALFRSLPGTPHVCYDAESDTFAEWHPYTNKATGKTGWISSGGLIRYGDPRGGPAGPVADQRTREQRADAASAVSAAIQNPERITDDHVPRLFAHLATMKRDDIKQFARQLGEKVGGKKAELADRLVAKVKALRQGKPVQGQALANLPPPEHPVDSHAREKGLTSLTDAERRDLRADYDAQTTDQGRQGILLVASSAHRVNAYREQQNRQRDAHVAAATGYLSNHPAMLSRNESVRREAMAAYQRGIDRARGADTADAARYATADAARELDAIADRAAAPTLARGQRTFTVTDMTGRPAQRRGWRVNLPSHQSAELYVYSVPGQRGRWQVANGRTGEMVVRASNRDAALLALRNRADRFPELIDNPATPNISTSNATPAPPPPPRPARPASAAAGPETYLKPDGPGAPREPTAPRNVHVNIGPEVHRRLQQFFGRDLDNPADMGLLAAVTNNHDGGQMSASDYGDSISFRSRGDGYTASRTLRKDARTGELYMKNDYFRVNFDRNDRPPPEWIQSNRAISGSKLLANQIAAAGKLGVKKLKTHAARADSDNPNNAMNGYYTWPRLGYDSEIPDNKWSRLPDGLKQLVTANALGSTKQRSILNLMQTAKGRDWWKKNGDDLYECDFDLTPGSLSMRVNEAYAKEQAAERAARAAANPPRPNPG